MHFAFLQRVFQCGLGCLAGVYERGDSPFHIVHRRGGDAIDFVNRLVGRQSTGFAIATDHGDFDAREFLVLRGEERGDAERAARGVAQQFVETLCESSAFTPLKTIAGS